VRFTEEGVFDEFIKDDFFVIRYQDKLFAASTTCPHMGGILQRDPQDSKRVSCGIHGSVFDTEGIAIVGPASTGLVRFGISVNKEGHAIVDPNQQFPQDRWTDKGCYLAMK
jgi:nitrite reductase/ring-hydroxylating ferredoxin subunit